MKARLCLYVPIPAAGHCEGEALKKSQLFHVSSMKTVQDCLRVESLVQSQISLEVQVLSRNLV